MSIELKWLGHGCWLIDTGSNRVILDPFLNESPTAPCKADDIQVDTILVSHGHFDHVADVASIAQRCSAKVVAIYEIATWFSQEHEVDNVLGMNIGGGVSLDFGHVKFVPAIHSSQLPDGSYGGEPGGFLLTIDGKKIYFACDTALFSDMSLIGEAGIDVAILPIGDLFTMGPDDSLKAIELIRPKQVLPAHYNTWPPIEQDAQEWASRVSASTDATPHVLAPGESLTI